MGHGKKDDRIVIVPKKKPRNEYILPARQRPAGPMKDRRTPRGGSGNEQWKREEKENA